MTNVPAVMGWDIGGVNTKAARLTRGNGDPVFRTVSIPYEVQRDPAALASVLAAAASTIGGEPTDRHGITMTAELSQAFRTKREGVGFILDAVESALAGGRHYVYTADGAFVGSPEARTSPRSVAASNWAATAHWLATVVPNCVLVDVGTTSTDLIPISDGKVVAQGRTDPDRLLAGELVYSGAVRTPAEAVARQVPLWGGTATVSADGFALIGDAHLWLGNLAEEEYTCSTPDGRPGSRVFAGERLARMVCADRDMLDAAAITDIALALARAQATTMAKALRRIHQRWPALNTAVIAGLGDFIAAEAAGAAGLTILRLEDRLGPAARIAPAASVAWLLQEFLSHR
jgi:(4-(4-[2-(gamma-L-glutamylamino)ethyl]phenoxymethyl)furan-2-yl)methanamine synthase